MDFEISFLAPEKCRVFEAALTGAALAHLRHDIIPSNYTASLSLQGWFFSG